MPSERVQRQIDSLLTEAEAAIRELDWATVRARARAALSLDRENGDAQAYLAAAEENLGELPGETAAGAVRGSSRPPEQQPPPEPSAPTSFVGGRYQVIRLLGEGGKKKVYLCHDTLLDRDVAFALIKTERLDEEGRQRIRREAQAMGRLGTHPHIVSVYDMGEEPGNVGTREPGGQGPTPYLVTEYMAGGDVEGLLQESDDQRLPIDQAVRLAQQICRGLAFAHGKGLVHRDLKPGNVWLAGPGPVQSPDSKAQSPPGPSGAGGRGPESAQSVKSVDPSSRGGELVAKIGDFGLAVALDRSRLTRVGMMVGTVAYMPPEQALGGQITAQADLYSLGAMLYELVCGRPPFLGDDSVAIIGQHINTPPVAPNWHNPRCPRPLEALILRLLAKDPGERPRSASEVLTALENLDLSAEAEPSPMGDGSQVLDSLAGGVFVGRQREMGELKAALEDVLSGRGRMITLVGEPGIGKSRTALELSTYAGLRQAQVLWGRCYEGPGAPPYWPWVQLLRSYVRDCGPEDLRSEMGAGAADIAEVVSEIRERVPDLRPAPRLEPDEARFRLFDSITSFLLNASRRRPLVLILEDLHWADRPSLLLLEFLARELPQSRLLVIGTYRDVDISRQHPLAVTLGELVKERLFQRVLLRGLDQEDVARFIELVAGGTASPQLVEAVYRQTEGNPLFVTEIVRLLVQEGHLGRYEGRGTRHEQERRTRTAHLMSRTLEEEWAVRIPEGVREVIGRRLDRLSERCNQVLTVASVVGREFGIDQVAPLIEDLPRTRLLEVLEEALGARIIEEPPRAAGRYQFTHALIQETLLEELSTTRRVMLHAQVAEALERLYGDDVEVHAAELAYHYGEAGPAADGGKLVRYSVLAGERALSSYAWEEAKDHFQRGLAEKEGKPVDREAAGALAGLGKAQAALLEIEDAVSNLRRAFDFYEQAGETETAVTIAEYPLPVMAGRLGEAPQLIQRALRLIPPDAPQVGRLMCRLGSVVHAQEADYDAAQAAFGRALEIARRENDRVLELQTLAFAALIDIYELRLTECLEKSQRAQAAPGGGSDLLSQVVLPYAVSISSTILGDLLEARKNGEACLPPAERLRHRSWLCRALWAHEFAAFAAGDWATARMFSERGLAVSATDIRPLITRAILEFQVGEFDKGEVFLERLRAVMRQTPPGPTVEYMACAIALAASARITDSAGRLPLVAAAAQPILSSLSATPLVVIFARASLALAAAQEGDGRAAEEQYRPLLPYRGTFVIGFTVDRVLGLLASVMENLASAEEHFEDALLFCRKGGYRPELAWTCYDYAEMLLKRDRSEGLSGASDRTRATELLEEALRIARELGMRPLLERVLAGREILSA